MVSAIGERDYARLATEVQTSHIGCSPTRWRRPAVALAQTVFHNKESLVLIRSVKRGLVLHFLFFKNEIRDFDAIAKGEGVKLPGEQLELGMSLIEKMSVADFEPESYADEYRERALAMIEKKVDWTTIYYGIFVDWQCIRRRFPLGRELKGARDKLGMFRKKNDAEYDFDKEKREREKAKIKAITLAEWLDRYLDLVKSTPSHETKKAQCAHLKRLLGPLPLPEVTKVRVMDYKNRRLSEPLVRNGNPVEGTLIKGATVNRETSCLIAALNLAAAEGLCEGAPRVKKERETPRERTLSDAEYRAILDTSPRWLQRVAIAANEAALDQGVLLKLTWDSVRDGLIVVKGGRDKTGAKQRVGISPELNLVLEELRTEYRRIPNTERRVFTKGGKPIIKATLRHAFDRALRDAKVGDAKIEDFQFRDFRHCARTRWADAGLPFEVGEVGIGHKIRGIAGRYINLSDNQIRGVFQEMFARSLQRNPEHAVGCQESNVSV